MKLLSLLLAPVTRIHSYLSHIQVSRQPTRGRHTVKSPPLSLRLSTSGCAQNLLQWTGKEHPDCSLLLGTERALRALLARCHVILEEDVRWEEGEEGRGRRSEQPLVPPPDTHRLSKGVAVMPRPFLSLSQSMHNMQQFRRAPWRMSGEPLLSVPAESRGPAGQSRSEVSVALCWPLITQQW